MKKRGLAPKAIINKRCEPIIAVGAIIADIPTVDMVETSLIETGDHVEVEGAAIKVRKLRD